MATDQNQLLTLLHEIYKNLTPIAPSEIKSGLDVIFAGVYLDPTMPLFGHIHVTFRHENDYYGLLFRARTPGQTAQMANQPLEIWSWKILHWNANKNIAFLERDNTTFGLQAFWLYTPDSCLAHEDDRLARTLIKGLKQYSVDHKLCKRIRKLEKRYQN